MQENIPIEEVFENLRCKREGLSTEAVEQRLAIFGHNKLEEKQVPLGFVYLCLLLLLMLLFLVDFLGGADDDFSVSRFIFVL